jgi:hypothetical protein
MFVLVLFKKIQTFLNNKNMIKLWLNNIKLHLQEMEKD